MPIPFNSNIRFILIRRQTNMDKKIQPKREEKKTTIRYKCIIRIHSHTEGIGIEWPSNKVKKPAAVYAISLSADYMAKTEDTYHRDHGIGVFVRNR